MTMLAEKMSAEQAREWGLVYMVTEPEALHGDRASARRSQLATQPTRALGLIKRGFNKSLGVDLDDAARLRGGAAARGGQHGGLCRRA